MSNTRNTIQFLLDGTITTVSFGEKASFRPSTTVLNYLRSLHGHKGVKEGCAEGDCGACTVVIAEKSGEKLIYKTLDSCLVFLPVLHGKQLITIENLAANGQLHPVQERLVDTNGSQCGFCTPGMVMSLFGLYKNHKNPSLETIGDAMAGNLCRCTGYKPIIDAAEKACSEGGRDHFDENAGETLRLLESISADLTPLELSHEGQLYLKPFTLFDALVMRKNHPEALVVNGATDAALRQTKKHELLPAVLDISDVNELKYFSESDEYYTVGAGTSIETLKCESKNLLPALHSILSIFGSLQIRNMATLGGNIGSASPIGDILPILFAMQAEIELQSVENKRLVNINDWITGYRSTVAKPDELITAVLIPKPAAFLLIKAYKVSRRKDLDISTVSAAFSLKLHNHHVEDIVLAYGGMAATTKRALGAESYLLNKRWNRETVEKAMEIIGDEFTPISDARAGAAYRKTVAKNLLLKFYFETLNES